MNLRNATLFLLVPGLIIFLSGCKKAENIFPDSAQGGLVTHTGCKNTLEKKNITGSLSVQKIRECIEYQYNGENTLLINHTNAVFNCCPGDILADTEFSKGLISIVEREAEHGCKCTCHYDLDFHFSNIPPGVYTIRVTCEGGEIREYTIDLNALLSGSKCWDSPLQNY